MARDSYVRIRTPFADDLDLPPPFRAIALREAGNAFAHAIGVADKEGPGALVHVGRYDFAELAVVLEPAEPLRTARRAIYAGLVALTDALAAAAPPEKPIDIVWPDAIKSMAVSSAERALPGRRTAMKKRRRPGSFSRP